jgi:hypothetical protein
MNEKQINRLIARGAKRIIQGDMFKLVWSDGSRASCWMDTHLISGVYAAIPVASEKRLGLY